MTEIDTGEISSSNIIRYTVPGAWRLPPTPSSAEVKERVELNICTPYGPSRSVVRWTLYGITSTYWGLVLLLSISRQILSDHDHFPHTYLTTTHDALRNTVIKPLKAKWLLYVHLPQHVKPLHFARRVLYVFLRFLVKRVTVSLCNITLLQY